MRKFLIASLLSACLFVSHGAFAEANEDTWSVDVIEDTGTKYIYNEDPFLLTIAPEEPDEIKLLINDYRVTFALYNIGKFGYILKTEDGESKTYEKDLRHDILIENEDEEIINTSGVQEAGKSLVTYEYTDEINEFFRNSEKIYIKYSYTIFKDQKDPIYQTFEIENLPDLMALYDEIIEDK